jgi:hypothetical protein
LPVLFCDVSWPPLAYHSSNFNYAVNKLVDFCLLKRLIAQTEIRFSNSLMESEIAEPPEQSHRGENSRQIFPNGVANSFAAGQ